MLKINWCIFLLGRYNIIMQGLVTFIWTYSTPPFRIEPWFLRIVTDSKCMCCKHSCNYTCQYLVFHLWWPTSKSEVVNTVKKTCKENMSDGDGIWDMASQWGYDLKLQSKFSNKENSLHRSSQVRIVLTGYLELGITWYIIHLDDFWY